MFRAKMAAGLLVVCIVAAGVVAASASASTRFTIANSSAGHFNTRTNAGYAFYTNDSGSSVQYPHDMWGQGVLLTNKKNGYYMGRIFDGQHFYSSKTEADGDGDNFRFGRVSSTGMVCAWAGPGAGVHSKPGASSWAPSGTGSSSYACPDSEAAAINLLPEIAISDVGGPAYNCGEGGADTGPQVTTLNSSTPFGYNSGWTRVGGGAKATGAITDSPLANFSLPAGTVVGYRYTSGSKAIVYVPSYGWGFVNASSVNRVQGSWTNTWDIELHGHDALQYSCSSPASGGLSGNTGPESWSGMNGKITSGIGVSSWGGGRMDLFARGETNGLVHRPYDGGTWYAWDDAGGGGAITSDPAATSWGVGRIDVVARGMDNALVHKYWTPSTGWYPSWHNLGGVVAGSPTIIHRTGDSLNVYVRGTNNHLYQKWWTAGTGWVAWEDLGGTLTSDPAAVSWDSGRIDIFARGTSGELIQKTWTIAGGWAAWTTIPGAVRSGPGATSVRPGQITLTARGSNLEPMRRSYENGVWTNWTKLGNSILGDPEIVSKNPGQFDIFGRSTSNGAIRLGGTL